MKLELEAEGKSHAVEVHTSGSRLRVRLDGREREAEVVWVSSREIHLLLDGRSYDLLVLPAEPEGHDVLVAGRRIRVGSAVAEAGAALGPRAAGPAGRVCATMPGKVVAVLVAAGEEVAAGQPLVVIEAMKMENELTAPAAGHVKAVRVSPGQVVEGGAVLVELG